MKRFHMNLSAENLAQGIRVYTAPFGVEPAVHKLDRGLRADGVGDAPYARFSPDLRGGVTRCSCRNPAPAVFR